LLLKQEGAHMGGADLMSRDRGQAATQLHVAVPAGLADLAAMKFTGHGALTHAARARRSLGAKWVTRN
jgi:hypothetical protein